MYTLLVVVMLSGAVSTQQINGIKSKEECAKQEHAIDITLGQVKGVGYYTIHTHCIPTKY